MNEMKRMFFAVEKVAETQDNMASAIITTNTVDRDGEVVDTMGMEFGNFIRNGVVLYGHEHVGELSLPVGKTTSLELLQKDNGWKGIKASWEFQQLDVSPFISAVVKSWQRGFLNTVSIGFRAMEYDGNIITKSELMEFSIVPIPANPEAMRVLGYTDEEVTALQTQQDKEFNALKVKVESLQSSIDALMAKSVLPSEDKSASGDAQLERQYEFLTTLAKALHIQN